MSIVKETRQVEAVPGRGRRGWRVRDARGNVAAALFEDYYREKQAGIQPSPVDHDPGVLGVALHGYPTRLTNAAVSARAKAGIPVTLRCSACKRGPDEVDELAFVRGESAAVLSRAFKAPVAALCPGCMARHGVRVVEDRLGKDPAAVLRFLRDADGPGGHPWAFDALAAELGAASDRARRLLRAHLDSLVAGCKAREVGGSGYVFVRGGILEVHEGQTMLGACAECGGAHPGDRPSITKRVRLLHDTVVVVERFKGAPVPELLCEACAAKYGVEIVGTVRICID
ncbi:MAG: hypothetical protein JW839_14715 [Candidatus Lokiarchaeota archaeon]|nr:hypothetical protein [Candidatus Lokiarchaeota archaeon]